MTKKTLKTIAGAADKPIRIGNNEIQCYVLEDETRVLTQASFLEALGRHKKANVRSEGGEERLPAILQGKAINSFISKELLEKSRPIQFRTPTGAIASGYLAEVLPMVCEVYLKAREARVLPPNQQHVAIQADILIRALAHLGIIALVDEATGYQDIRARNALAKILEKFIAKELQSWTQTFPEDFYKEMFRLRDWSYPALVDGGKPARPSVVGRYTNDLVYERVAPGVLNELRRKNPKTVDGHRKSRHHQWFTPDIGHPKLKEHLASVIALMRASSGWDQFLRNMNRALPKMNETIEMPFDD